MKKNDISDVYRFVNKASDAGLQVNKDVSEFLSSGWSKLRKVWFCLTRGALAFLFGLCGKED